MHALRALPYFVNAFKTIWIHRVAIFSCLNVCSLHLKIVEIYNYNYKYNKSLKCNSIVVAVINAGRKTKMEDQDFKFHISRRNLLVGSAVAATLTGVAPGLVSAATAPTPADYSAKTLTIGLFSGDISALAKEKATNPGLKQFAGLEYDEASAVGGLLLASGASKPSRPDDLTRTFSALREMKPGDAFDHLYLAAEIKGHTQLLEIQKQQAGVHADGLDHTVSTIMVPFIESHLAMLQQIKSDFRT